VQTADILGGQGSTLDGTHVKHEKSGGQGHVPIQLWMKGGSAPPAFGPHPLRM